VRQGVGEFTAAARQPVWLWSGALMSVVIVLAITVAGSRIGVIATVSVLLAGQFAAGAAIDRYGLLGARIASASAGGAWSGSCCSPSARG
jgi:uncharacterized membrane protein YdcZ (DUF606 family)